MGEWIEREKRKCERTGGGRDRDGMRNVGRGGKIIRWDIWVEAREEGRG